MTVITGTPLNPHFLTRWFAPIAAGVVLTWLGSPTVEASCGSYLQSKGNVHAASRDHSPSMPNSTPGRGCRGPDCSQRLPAPVSVPIKLNPERINDSAVLLTSIDVQDCRTREWCSTVRRDRDSGYPFRVKRPPRISALYHR